MIRDFSNINLYNKKYIPLLNNKKRYIMLLWGWWSWKSRFEAQKEIIKTYNKSNRLIAVRKVADTLKDSVYAELTGVIKDWNLQWDFEITKSPLYIRNKLTWSDVLFRWMDDPEKIKSVSNPTRVWIEEATELNKWDFDQLDIRLRGNKELQLTCSYNPISDQHWLITDFWNFWTTEDVECLHSTYKDNRFVWHEQYEKVFERLKKQNPRLYDIYALGIPWQAIEGLIFDYKTIWTIPEEARLKGYWLDFWYNDPTALVAIYEYNDSIILDEVIYKSYMNNQDLVKLMKSLWVWNERIVWDNARPEAIDEIHKAWFDIIPCTKWKDSVINWIQLMKQYNLVITAHSSNLIKEFNNYTWIKDRNGWVLDKPIDAFNHWIDASRYWINEFYTKEQEFDIFIW